MSFWNIYRSDISMATMQKSWDLHEDNAFLGDVTYYTSTVHNCTITVFVQQNKNMLPYEARFKGTSFSLGKLGLHQ